MLEYKAVVRVCVRDHEHDIYVEARSPFEAVAEVLRKEPHWKAFDLYDYTGLCLRYGY